MKYETQTKTCKSCHTSFSIGAPDFEFYKKIQVPAPTWCPRCRLKRRLSFSNLVNLYERPCDFCAENMASMYPPGAPYVVYCPRCWWSDKWDPRSYGRAYDFSRPFFEQFQELFRVVPIPGLALDFVTAESSSYSNYARSLKNCYSLFHANSVEDSAYGFNLFHSQFVFDSSLIHTCERCYDCMHSYKNTRCVGLRSQNTECFECAFLKDCGNCQNCFASANLRNKKYYIFNKPHTKEEYIREMQKVDLGSYATYTRVKREAEEHWKKFPPRPVFAEFTRDWSGSHVFLSRNCYECYEVIEARDCKYLFMMWDGPIKNCYDVSGWGNNAHLLYEGCGVGENVSHLKFCQESGINVYHAEYCKLSTGGSNHFGCVSMRNENFCILNKQYSENDFTVLREKIIAHMNEMPYTSQRTNSPEAEQARYGAGKEQIVYRYGEFFPIEFSPHEYNETIAQKFFPLVKEEAVSAGFRWREPDPRPSLAVTKPAANLPDHIKDATDGVLNEVVGCAACLRGFKIIRMELDFLRRMNLPLPRLCPACRINEKLDIWVNDLTTVARSCSSCGAGFETPKHNEAVEHILCGECYRKQLT